MDESTRAIQGRRERGMTREEAKALLLNISAYDIDTQRGMKKQEAIEMAIKALEQEPCDKCVYSTSEGCQYDDITETIPPFDDCISRQAVLKGKVIHQSCDGIEIINGYAVPVEYIENLPPVTPQLKTGWIPVSEMLPELNRPLLVTAYHRVYYGHLISENGNYGYPVFRIHGLGDKNRDWVQETMSHGPYSLGRIDAWMYLDIPEPYKPQEGGDQK